MSSANVNSVRVRVEKPAHWLIFLLMGSLEIKRGAIGDPRSKNLKKILLHISTFHETLIILSYSFGFLVFLRNIPQLVKLNLKIEFY